MTAKFSPDGQQLAAADVDGAWVLWDVNSGFRVADFPRDPVPTDMKALGWNVPGDISFSPDGKQLITSSARSDDNYSKIWGLRSESTPAPSWVIAAAEAIGGKRLDAAGTLRPVSFEEHAKLGHTHFQGNVRAPEADRNVRAPGFWCYFQGNVRAPKT